MNLRRILAVMKNEFLFLRRDRRTLLASVLLPVLLLFLLSYSITNNVQPTEIGVFNADNSTLSRSFLRTIEHTSPFRLKIGNTPEQVLSWVEEGRVKASLFIPAQFSGSLLKGDSPSLSMVLEGIEPLASRLYLHSFESARLLGVRGVKDDFYFLSGSPELSAPFGLSLYQLYNPSLDHFAFIIPGLIGCIVMSIIPLFAAISIVRERENGSFNRILASPTSEFEFLVGKLGTYFLLAALNCLILSLLGVFYFEIPFRGNPFGFLGVIALFSLWTAAFGLLISTLTKNQMTAFTTSLIFTLLPAFIFSGVFYPLHGIPVYLRWITYTIPIRYFVEISREIFLKGNSIVFWWNDLMGLLLVTLSTLAILFYRINKISEGPR